MGDLAIWAMGADGGAATKQEAALTVLRTMVMRARASSDGARGAGAANGFLGPERWDRAQADVGLPATGPQLRSLVGTNQPGETDDEYDLMMVSRWQQGEVWPFFRHGGMQPQCWMMEWVLFMTLCGGRQCELCRVARVLHIGPGAMYFSSDPPGNHKFDPDSPKNSWDPDPGLKNNAQIGSRSQHDLMRRDELMDKPQPWASCGQKSLNFAVSCWVSSSAMATQKIQKCSASPPVDRHLLSHLEGHTHPSSHLKGHYPPLSD